MADATKFIAKADDALKKRNYDYAIQMYESAMEVDPGNADARRNYRLALCRKYDQVGYPKSLGLSLGGMTMALSKSSEKALVEGEKAVAKDPKSVKYNLRVAEKLAEMGHNAAAIAVLDFVAKNGDIKGDKQGPAALMLLAKALAADGQVDEANKALNMAVRLAPNDKSIKELQKDLAAKTYNKKVGSAKSSYELVQNRDEANLLEAMRKGNITEEDADKLLAQEEQKLKENPLDRRAIRAIGEVLAKRKKFLDAYNRLTTFLKVDPSATEIGEIAAKYKNTHFDNMIRGCQLKAQQEPERAAAWQAKENQVREEKKKFQLEEYGRMVEAAPTDLDKRFLLGKALLDAGDFAEAFKHFQKAVKSPKYAKPANLMMGQCLVQMDRYEMAEMAFSAVEKELNEADEDLSKELMYAKADLMERRGDPTAALEQFRQLYMQDMEFRDVEGRIDRLKGQAV
jgi:tetratricopeptide (TPR) repeat protein